MATKGALFFFLFLALLSFAYANSETSSKNDDEEVMRSMFPDNFLFGTATSAYQIEGAYLEDGKSLGNWDVFTHVKGGVKNGDDGDIANDHFHRYMEDIEIMESLGVNAYRFSISWPRILPRGRLGGINPSGINFYNKIIDNLLLKGIEPFVTVHHHDIPQELEEKYQGWLNPLIQEDFLHLAKTCFENFGDRVKYWITINEPNLVAEMAYIRGWYPPAHCSRPFGNCSAGNSDTEPLIAIHNMLLSHAKAAKLYHDQFRAKQGGAVGIVVNSFMFEPYQDNEADRQAVDRALAFNTAWVLDPLMYGYYPPEMRLYHGNELPSFSPEEIELVKGSLDFLGINHYSTLYAKDCLHSPCSSGNDRPIRGYVNTTGEREGIPIGERLPGLLSSMRISFYLANRASLHEQTTMERFFVVPRGMEKIMDYVTRRYPGMPIFVTENGYSSSGEQENGNDVPQDVERIKFHKAYLAALARAIRKGADVRGYFIWSLMDSFEWIHGYSVRFGLYYINRRTLERIPKLSARWYNDFLKGKGNI